MLTDNKPDHLPDEIEHDFYTGLYPDLSKMDAEEAREHFLRFGRREGRTASRASHRKEFVDLCSTAPSILEIGPFCNPSLKGRNVYYFDVLDSQGLRKRAQAIGYPIKTVPNVNYVDPNGDLSVVDREFAAVLSSHCIEHQPDFIHHLKQVEKLLEDGGKYFVLIPDKRYCFDHFIAETTIANIVDAHLNEHRTHRLESVIEHRALTTHNDPIRHWKDDHADPGYSESIPDRVRAAIREFQNARGSYLDVHAWQFTPASFRQICENLFALNYTRLRSARVYDTPYGSNEFAAILQLHQ